MSLIAELKSRNVFKVGTAYLALGWVVTQVTATVVPYMRLPEWTVPMVLWVGVISFPFVLGFSWIYELTPEGLKREHEVDRSTSITHHTGRKLDYTIIALLVLAIGLFGWSQLRGTPAPVGSGPLVGAGLAREQPSSTAEVDRAQGALQQESALPQQSAVPQTAAVPADDKSIAVLPFSDMSAAKDQEYMSDGISEELLNLLAKVPELRVIARTSSFAFKNKELEISEIAHRLNVANVLEGSVRTAGNRVRITAQLVRASDSSHLWSETYDRTLDDIFAVQDEIAAAVVSQLKLKLLGPAVAAHTSDPAAYALFLQARQIIRASVAGTSPQAIALLQQALAIDPAYSDAWAALAGVYHSETNFGIREQEEGLRLAREANARALAIDPKHPIALADLGMIAWQYDNDPKTAAEHIARALEVEPANLQVLGSAASLMTGLGRMEQAFAIGGYALDRDPVNPNRQSGRGYANMMIGHYDEALAAFRAALALSPGRASTHYFMAATLALKGDGEAALQEARLEKDPSWQLDGLALANFVAGKKTEADAALQKLIANNAHNAAYNIAYIYGFRNEADSAFEWLERAVSNKDPGLSDIASEPRFRSIRDDPRWAPFLRKLGRAPEQLAAIKFDVKLP